MSRGSQFTELVTMLRNDVGRSSDVSVGVADLPELKQRLNVAYEFLYADYDWPHLRKVFTRVTLNASQRYYNLPATLDYDRIENAHVWYNGQAWPIERGITHDDYSLYDSENGDTSTPVQKWDIRYTGSTEQIEVWPMPAASGQTLALVGTLKFTRLVNDIDQCLLDDNMVVLRASAEILARQGSKDAGLRTQEAQQYYDLMKRRSKGASRIRRVGQAGSGPFGGRTGISVTVR